ncbi:MAG TPA: SCO family protein [Solirubrobacteraceae bacterium]|nr:SCO family protein [Solirubrobacteraceae bacterium]
MRGTTQRVHRAGCNQRPRRRQPLAIWEPRAWALILVAVMLVAGALAPSARADGDPASDVLVGQALFLPADAGVSGRQQAQLEAFLRAARSAGFPIRVAIIPDAYDLGSVSVLWRKPQTYAEFLGVELSLVYKQRLLVVMPNGFGLNWPGHSATSAQRLLAQTTVPPGGAGLLAGTEAAVRELASASGIKIAANRPGTGSGDTAEIAIASGAAIVLILLGGLAARRGVFRRRVVPHLPSFRRPRISSSPLGRWSLEPRWAVPGVALVCCAALGVPILAVSLIRGTGNASGTTTPTSVATPYTFPAGERRAPELVLTDQNGHPVSLVAYRGRPVIVTFIDPLCRNLCPLAAQVLDQVDRQLPASQRIPIIAVSVDVYADTRANLLLDFQKWRLVPQWQWAVGAPVRLAEVWNRWQVGVSVATKRIAGTTVHFITHDEVAFLVDRAGFVRDVFAWPYEPQNIEMALRQLARS